MNMPMQRLTADEKTTKRRQYTRENRALWKQLGIRMCSAPVHDDDREEVLAEIEVLRCKRLAQAAEDKETKLAVVVQLGRRNMAPPTPPKVLSGFLKQCEALDNVLQIEQCLNEAQKAHASFRGVSAALGHTEDEMAKQRLFAKEVAYGNLVNAWFKLAKAKANAGKRVRVFGGKDPINAIS